VARPASVRPPARAPLRLRSELHRLRNRLAQEIDTGLRRTTPPPESIHDLHRDLRRFAIGLAVWERLVPSGRKSAVAELTRRVRRLARLVGRVRDRDVTAELLMPPGRSPPHSDRDWAEFLRRLREDTQAGRELLRAFLTSERQGGLLDRLEEALALEPRRDAVRSLHRILAEERYRRQGRVRKAHRRARRNPSSERLHRLRIRIRQWRHLSALEGTAGAPPDAPPSWRRLQSRLGRLHDLDVAIATIPEQLNENPGAKRLLAARRRLRRSVRRSLEQLVAGPEGTARRGSSRGSRT
jgi:CHAD domain-containing protein